MLVLLIFSFICPVLFTNGQIGRNYKVFRLKPKTASHLEYFKNLKKSDAKLQLEFWKEPTDVGNFVDIMVLDKDVAKFKQNIFDKNITNKILVEDIAKLTKARILTAKKRQNALSGFNRILRDDASGPSYDFGGYQTLPKMMNYLHLVSQFYPNITRLYSIGKSHQGRPIPAIEIGSPAEDNRKPMIWVDGGVHAREWASPHTAMYFIDQLVKGYNRDPELTNLVNDMTWVIVPVVNPDGYSFTWSSVDPDVALWRKNRSPKVCKNIGGSSSCCFGSDLNRNFDADWGKTDVSDDPCEEIYPGTSSFSEPEARAVRDYINPRSHRIHAFITLHSYAQIWSYPYAFEQNAKPSDVADLREVAQKAAIALRAVQGTKYKVGRSAKLLYPASGTSVDWAKAKASIKYSYLLELPPDGDLTTSDAGFFLDEDKLIPTARETFEGVKVVAQAALKYANYGKQHISRNTSTRRQNIANRRNQRFRLANRGRTSESVFDIRNVQHHHSFDAPALSVQSIPDTSWLSFPQK